MEHPGLCLQIRRGIREIIRISVYDLRMRKAGRRER